MRWGTSHFVSRAAAERYYAAYYGVASKRNVARMLAEGVIYIGKPALQLGQRLSVIPGEGRYMIEDDA